jgi:uncharacterized oxidoreductase
MPIFTAQYLEDLSSKIFVALGTPKEDAHLISKLLVKANLTGHDSHGVIRIPLYVQWIEEGIIKPKANPKVIKETISTALIDGDKGFGQVVATKGMKLAIEKAKESGIAAVGIYNCGHVGRLADYTMMALKHDMIGLMFVIGRPSAAPFGGIDRIFNPSPLSAAIPTEKEKPYILDISTSVCAAGKIAVKYARGERLPEGWIIDKDGNPSTDPEDFYKGGAILPMGGMVGYKGYGLMFLVDVLAGALTEAGCSSSKEFKKVNGVFAVAINISAFTSVEKFKRRVDELIRRVKSSRKARGFNEILIPGEPEFREEEIRLKKGIYVEDSTWNKIEKIAKRLLGNKSSTA